VLTVALTLLWFATLDARHLFHPDEGRYAEIAREMYVTGDWVTPRLNDFKYFEKPPFQYWVTAAAFDAFGVREWGARLWPAAAGFLAILSIAVAGHALGGITLGAYGGLALATTVWHVVIAQIVTLDSGLSFFLTVAFSAFVIAQRDVTGARARKRWMWLAAASLAGATLSKGLVALVIPGGALVAYTALTRDFAVWKRLHLASGFVLYLVLAAPWFVLVSRANDEFFQFFFIHEHFHRFLHGGDERPGHWYYFVPYFIVGILPWLSIVFVGARRAWVEGTPNAQGFSWQRFALSWAAFVFLFFSASGSKLPSYILPMFPPLALVVAWVLLRLDTRTLLRLTWPGVMAAALITLLLFAGWDRYVPRFAGERVPVESLVQFGAWVKPAIAVATAGGAALLVALLLAPDSPKARFTGFALQSVAVLAALQLTIVGFDALSTIRSSSAILRAAQQAEAFAPDAPFYQIAMYDQTVPFYLGRATRVVEYRAELSLGIDAEPQKQIPALEAWIAEWQGLAKGYALMDRDLEPQLRAQNVPMRVLARDARRMVVSRQ
jgi:4-amino-4-deoxy-L-arabinose transferase-like glycosyltransferase